MATNVLTERKFREIEEIAAGWGTLLAREAFPEGPGLDVSFADMEDVVVRATMATDVGQPSGLPRLWQDVRTETEVSSHGRTRWQCRP